MSAVFAAEVPQAKVGVEWQVKKGKRSYVGLIAAIGKYLHFSYHEMRRGRTYY